MEAKLMEILRLFVEQGYVSKIRGRVAHVHISSPKPHYILSLKYSYMDSFGFDLYYKEKYSGYTIQKPPEIDILHHEGEKVDLLCDLQKITEKATTLGWIIPYIDFTMFGWSFVWPYENIKIGSYPSVSVEIFAPLEWDIIKEDRSLNYFPDLKGMQLKLL
jgi:hypothetical protein